MHAHTYKTLDKVCAARVRAHTHTHTHTWIVFMCLANALRNGLSLRSELNAYFNHQVAEGQCLPESVASKRHTSVQESVEKGLFGPVAGNR